MSCPTTLDDPRLPLVEPERQTVIDGSQFVEGVARSFRWTVEEEDCDAIVPSEGYVLKGANTAKVAFQPSRPAPYKLKLEVTGVRGEHESCELRVPVRGRGMRFELCWDTSTLTDLDLYLHTPFDTLPWLSPSASGVVDGINGTTCNLANCTADLRFKKPRTNWGYADSPLSACDAGPAAPQFRAKGICPNPRAGLDNNQDLAEGTAERIQLDNPKHGQRFRVMVQNFDNGAATPHVFAYCAGQRAGAVEAPNDPPLFRAANPGRFGVMWRAFEVVPQVDGAGNTLGCSVTALQAPNSSRLDVTIDDPRF